MAARTLLPVCASAQHGAVQRAPLRCSPAPCGKSPLRSSGLRLVHRGSRLILAATEGGSAEEAAADAAEAKSKSVLSRDNPDLVEKFATIGTGSAECKSCQYVYEPKLGDPNYPVSKGTQFEDLPADWRCPVCGAEQKLFVSRAKQVSGFAQNQGYGLGSNSMTSEQKSLLIYGTLAFFFALFIGGYLLE